MMIPTVPNFVTGDTSMLKMRQLSQCVSFVSDASAFPVWHAYLAATQTLASAGTRYTVEWPYVAFDSDRVLSPAGVTVVTPGFYTCEACIPFQTQSNANFVTAQFQFTAGTYNPQFTAGATVDFGTKSGTAYAGTGDDEVLNLDDLCPVACYPGDSIAVRAWGSLSNTVIDANDPVSATGGRFVANFTGRWVRCGT